MILSSLRSSLFVIGRSRLLTENFCSRAGLTGWWQIILSACTIFVAVLGINFEFGVVFIISVVEFVDSDWNCYVQWLYRI